MLIIPLQAIPNQVVTTTLANQNCRIAIRQLTTGLYCDLYVGNVLIIAGVICENVNRIVRDAYLGFIGDLLFLDTQGDSDPDYTGLGSRFQLCYITADELAAAQEVAL